jgi:hypothetical protein
MSPRGTKQRPSLPKSRPTSHRMDVLKLIQERDRCIASDTRTAADRWLGDPPPHRSALAQRIRGADSNSGHLSGDHHYVIRIAQGPNCRGVTTKHLPIRPPNHPLPEHVPVQRAGACQGRLQRTIWSCCTPLVTTPSPLTEPKRV